MRTVIQRVSHATVQIEHRIAARIAAGLVVLLGVERSDTAEDALYLSRKIAGLRLFDDESGKLNRSISDTGGEALVISQFTLYAETANGSRPNFSRAAPAKIALQLYNLFIDDLRHNGIAVQTGEFQTRMKVNLCNEGPVTIICDSRKASAGQARGLHTGEKDG